MMYAIDFGTSNSLLAAATETEIFPPIPLDPLAADATILRSVLYLPDKRHCYFGEEATREYVNNDMQGRLLRSVKKFLPMRSFVGTYVEDRAFALEDIIATFLGEMRRRANQHFGRDVRSVLLGRPARFSENEADDLFAQERLTVAANRAGFERVEFCAEPLAAAFEFKSTLREPKVVLVADFGGGTSDFTVIRLHPGKEQELEVLALGGVPLAGDSLDGSLMRHRISRHFGAEVQYRVPFGDNLLTMPKLLMESICSPADISVLRDRDTQDFFRKVKAWSLGPDDHAKMENLFTLIEDQIGFALFERIEAAKRGLSENEKSDFTFKYSSLTLHETISRAEFEDYASTPLKRILRSLDETLAVAGLRPEQVDLVCATGGTAKVFALREALAQRFGAEKIQQHQNFHSIVYGLSRVAQELLK